MVQKREKNIQDYILTHTVTDAHESIFHGAGVSKRERERGDNHQKWGAKKYFTTYNRDLTRGGGSDRIARSARGVNPEIVYSLAIKSNRTDMIWLLLDESTHFLLEA